MEDGLKEMARYIAASYVYPKEIRRKCTCGEKPKPPSSKIPIVAHK